VTASRSAKQFFNDMQIFDRTRKIKIDQKREESLKEFSNSSRLKDTNKISKKSFRASNSKSFKDIRRDNELKK